MAKKTAQIAKQIVELLDGATECIGKADDQMKLLLRELKEQERAADRKMARGCAEEMVGIMQQLFETADRLERLARE